MTITSRVSDEATGYRLHYDSYSGTAGDSLALANGMKFTTYDHDQDNSFLYNCADLHKVGGSEATDNVYHRSGFDSNGLTATKIATKNYHYRWYSL